MNKFQIKQYKDEVERWEHILNSLETKGKSGLSPSWSCEKCQDVFRFLNVREKRKSTELFEYTNCCPCNVYPKEYLILAVKIIIEYNKGRLK